MKKVKTKLKYKKDEVDDDMIDEFNELGGAQLVKEGTNLFIEGKLREVKAFLLERYESLDEATAEHPDIFEGNSDISESLNLLIDEDENLSEDFKARAKVLFEATVSKAVADKEEEMEKEKEEEMEDMKESNYRQLCSKVDSYLSYVVNEWSEENKVAIESSVKASLMEDFVGKLHGLFAESNITIPEGKVDVLEQAKKDLTESENRNKRLAQEKIALEEANQEFIIDKIVSEATSHLSQTDVDRVVNLVEGVEYTDPKSFATKVNILVETFSKGNNKSKPKGTLVEDILIDEDDDPAKNNDPMSRYVNALARD